MVGGTVGGGLWGDLGDVVSNERLDRPKQKAPAREPGGRGKS
jgi:hypothetical protein